MDGKIYAMACHIPGISVCGHEIPDMNNSGTDVNITSNITFSLYLTIHDSAIPKNITDVMNGIIKPIKSIPDTNVV